MSAQPVPGLRGAVAIAGVADAASPTGILDSYGLALETRMVSEALADSGLTLGDVDGVARVTQGLGSLELAEHLGVRPRWTDTTNTGGASFEILVQHAASAIAMGLAEVVVISYGATPRGDAARGLVPDLSWMSAPSPYMEWEVPYGVRQPIAPYALAASRHMAQYGTRPEQLAEIVVSSRQWAAMNPRARRREPLTVDEVLASPFEVEPIHRLEICQVTDGAGAVVLTGADRAHDLATSPVFILGVGTCHDHGLMISQMPDLTVTAGVQSAHEAFSMAGIKPPDVDVLMTYDSFTITLLLALEDLGFCPKGEGGAFVQDGRLGPGGELPTNTNGGGLSYTHPGMYGIFLLVESVRQLRGEAGDSQVPGAKVAVAHGCGGILSALSTVVLATEVD